MKFRHTVDDDVMRTKVRRNITVCVGEESSWRALYIRKKSYYSSTYSCSKRTLTQFPVLTDLDPFWTSEGTVSSAFGQNQTLMKLSVLSRANLKDNKWEFDHIYRSDVRNVPSATLRVESRPKTSRVVHSHATAYVACSGSITVIRSSGSFFFSEWKRYIIKSE